MDAHNAIVRTITLYGQLIDDLRLDEWGELFTEDATWSAPGVSFRGRSEIVKGVGAMEPKTKGQVKHLAFTPIIELDGDNRARAWTDLITLAKSKQGTWSIVSVGRYYDLLEYSDGRWRFANRTCDVDWQADGGQKLELELLRPPAR
jgi:3-phenylpropionate/cinnamic acid dioxygenase small subunit